MNCQYCNNEVDELRDLGSGEWMCYKCYMCLCCQIWDQLEVKHADNIKGNSIQNSN